MTSVFTALKAIEFEKETFQDNELKTMKSLNKSSNKSQRHFNHSTIKYIQVKRTENMVKSQNLIGTP